MSVRVMSAVWQMKLPCTTKMVLLALADSANDDGFCWPGLAHLAAKTGLSERAIRAAFARLEAEQVLTRQFRFNHSTLYRLDLDTLEALIHRGAPNSPPLPGRGAPRAGTGAPRAGTGAPRAGTGAPRADLSVSYPSMKLKISEARQSAPSGALKSASPMPEAAAPPKVSPEQAAANIARLRQLVGLSPNKNGSQ